MFSQSVIVARLKESVLPVSSKQLLFARAEEAGVSATVARVFYDDGFACNTGISLRDARGKQYLFILSGPDCSEADLAELVFDLMKAIDDLIRESSDIKLFQDARELRLWVLPFCLDSATLIIPNSPSNGAAIADILGARQPSALTLNQPGYNNPL